MANTYTQVHIQIVFAVRYRQNLIQSGWEDELYKYMTGIIQNHGHKVLALNGMPDHIHILIGMRPTQGLSVLVQQVKQDSSKWINLKGYVKGRFSWQSGYGAFSYSKSQVPKIIAYIRNQKEHHKIKTFTEEYIAFLKKNEIDFKTEYIFKPVT